MLTGAPTEIRGVLGGGPMVAGDSPFQMSSVGPQSMFQPISMGISTNPFAQIDGQVQHQHQHQHQHQRQHQYQHQPQPIQSPGGSATPAAVSGSQSPYLLGVSPGVRSVSPSPSLSPVFAARALGSSPFEKDAYGQSAGLPADSRFAKLNALLAREEGMDTFGNTGSLRVPIGSGFASGPDTADPQNTSSLVSATLSQSREPLSFSQVPTYFYSKIIKK
ncbi:hypothetical protein J3Q64DRAFT_1761668 [Phycomyces blakesleeanus]|uniref:Uncharacterized protein n=1 Tax=Phycomyces blakesleeanus TaxID=4837 RepID=A0ABR3ASW0_PHYBL